MSEGGDPPFRVDSYDRGWSTAEKQALAKWSQGSLLKGAQFAFVTGDATALDVERSIVSGEGWMIVTSQTCDVGATGPGRLHPFVACSPLIPLDEFPNHLHNAIRAWNVVYLAPVGTVNDDGFWVADLRVSIPVHKNALAARTPVPGFTDGNPSLTFADHLAHKVRRPALPDAVAKELRDLLEQHVKNLPAKADGAWIDDTEHVRLELRPGPLEPDTVTVHFMTMRKLTTGEKKEWRKTYKRAKNMLRTHDITLRPFVFVDIHDQRAPGYRDMLPLLVKGLDGPLPW